MIYHSYNTEAGQFASATNIRSLAEAIELPYHTLYRQIKDMTLESESVEYRKFVFGTSDELLKGKQRYHGKVKVNKKKVNNTKSNRQDSSNKQSGVEGRSTPEVLKEGTKSEQEMDGVNRKERGVADEKGDGNKGGSEPATMSKFDSYFNEIPK